MKQSSTALILVMVLSFLFSGCEKSNNENTEIKNQKFEAIEIESQCFWNSIDEENIYIINSENELPSISDSCSFQFDDSLFETHTLIIFKGIATCPTMISEISYDIYSFDNSNFTLKIKVVGSAAQMVESRNVHFSALIDKIENLESFESEYINIDCCD